MTVRRSLPLLQLVLALFVFATCGKDEPTQPTATERPTIVGVTPTAWSIVTGITEVTVEAPGAESVSFQVNSRSAVPSPAPFHFSLDTNNLPNGSHQLRLVAQNSLGTVDTTLTLIVGNTGRGIVVVAPVRELHIGPGDSVSVSAIVAGTSDTGVDWSIDESTPSVGPRGSIDGQGLYKAPRHVPTPPDIALIARSRVNPGSTAEVLVYLEGISVQINPEMIVLPVERAIRLTSQVFGSTDQSVAWSLDDDATHGTMSADGLFTAPSTLPEPPTARVRATRVADPSQSATARIQLIGPITVIVSPIEATLLVGHSLQLTGTAQGAPDTLVEWFPERRGLSLGLVTRDGLYTAPGYPPDPPIFRVWARSQFDTLSRAAVTITVVEPPPPVQVTVSPSAARVATGSSRQFAATVEHTDNPAVVWSMTGAGSLSPSGLYTAPAVVPANAAVVITAASVADPSRGGSASVTIVSAVDVAMQEMIETLTRSGYRSAMISDQALVLVVTGLMKAAQLNGGVITTTGVVRRVSGGGSVYEPPAPGDRRLSFIGSGPRIDLTVDSLDVARLYPEFGGRVSGSNFVGYLACRLQIDGVADLRIETSGVEDAAYYGVDFDRTVRGSVLAQGKNWELDIHHSGKFAESFHFGQTEHHVDGHLTVGGILLTVDEQIDFWFGENCYVSNGGFYVGRSWQMANRADSGSEVWRIESDYRDNVDSHCGFYDRVRYPEDWHAGGSLAIGATLAGPLEFNGPVVFGAVPPPFVIRFFDRTPLAIPLPRFREDLVMNPLLY